jgi:hypothetical protein
MTLPTLRASRAPALGHETARTALPGGTGSASRVRTRPPPSPTATRRSSTNAPQRADAPQRKVAIERAGAKSRHDFVPGSRTGSNGGNVDSLTATRPTETHVPTLATSVRFYRRRCSSRRVEEGFSLHPNSGLTGCLASTPAHRQNEGFATRVSTRRVISPSSCLGNVRGERRDQGRARSPMSYRATRDRHRAPQGWCRPSTNAPRRAGPAPRSVAVGTAVCEERSSVRASSRTPAANDATRDARAPR